MKLLSFSPLLFMRKGQRMAILRESWLAIFEAFFLSFEWDDQMSKVINHLSTLLLRVPGNFLRLLFQWPVLVTTMKHLSDGFYENEGDFIMKLNVTIFIGYWSTELGFLLVSSASRMIQHKTQTQKNHHHVVMNKYKWMFDAVKLTFINEICCKYPKIHLE